jgi:hypothetical protein
MPGPETGGGIDVFSTPPVKRTLLSFTCNIAAGAVVFIPTLPIWPEAFVDMRRNASHKIVATDKNVNLFICYSLA